MTTTHDIRKLLELAAKAGAPKAPAHTQGWHYSKHGPRGEGMYAASDRSQHWFWNPATDYGDALRLALKLNFRLELSSGDFEYCEVRDEDGVRRLGYADINHCKEYTSLAILLAAAAIGEAMP